MRGEEAGHVADIGLAFEQVVNNDRVAVQHAKDLISDHEKKIEAERKVKNHAVKKMRQAMRDKDNAVKQLRSAEARERRLKQVCSLTVRTIPN